MRRPFANLSVALAIAGSGCMAGMGAQHAAQAAAPEMATGGAMPADMMQACPMAVPATQLAVADTPDGEAVTFTTASDHVAELRSRVHAMADMHNRHHAQGGAEQMHGGMQHGGMMEGMGGMDASMMPPPSRAAVEDVDGGARLAVTPNDPADLDRLRSTVRMHAQHMQETGTCGHGEPAAR